MKIRGIYFLVILSGFFAIILSNEFGIVDENDPIRFEHNLVSEWIKKQKYLLDLFNITHLDLTSLINIKKIYAYGDEEEDHPCEKKTSFILKHYFDGIPLPEEYDQFYKFVIYSGTGLNDLGDYSSCQKMNIFKYHTIQFNLQFGPQNLTLETGLCYFRECDSEYLNKAKSDIISLLNSTNGLNIAADAINIIDPDEKDNDFRNRKWYGFLISASILGLLALFPIVQYILKTAPNKRASLIYDADEEKKSRKSFLENSLPVNKDKTKTETFLEFFDVSKNASKLLEIKHIDSSHEALKVFDGVRFLSTFWVVLGHVFVYCLLGGFKNLAYFSIFSKSWKLCLVASGFYAVDVFFFMSGFMLCLGLNRFLNQKINKVKIIFMAFITRYLRLLPIYLFIIILMTYIMPYLGGGPTYYKSEMLNSVCPKYFWHNLLYINNLINYENSIPCAGHTWYLANDMQFFLIALLITIIFNKMSIVKNFIFLSMFIASSGYQIYEAYTENYRFNDYTHPSKGQANFFNGYYIKPWNRICPYILGIFFCELFMKTEVHLSSHKKGKHLPADHSDKQRLIQRFNTYLMTSNVTCAIIFISSLIMITYAVFITYFVNNYDIPDMWHALFLTFNKVIFVFGLGCIVHLTFLGKLGIIKEFLSFKLFSLLAKFTYGTYLIHFYILTVFFYSLNYVIFFNFSDFIFMSIGLTVTSTIISFILTILLESPVVNATKLLLYGGETKHKE